MATHSRILAWEIPWTEEPGGLRSLGWQSQHSWGTWAAAAVAGHCDPSGADRKI